MKVLLLYEQRTIRFFLPIPLKRFFIVFSLLVSFGSKAQVRPDINSFSSTDRATLANLMLEYITLDVVQKHCDFTAQTGISGIWIHSDFDLLPFHRMYLEGMEDFLLQQGYPEFVPLPKWDQSTCLPVELQFIDALCFDIGNNDCGDSYVNCDIPWWCPDNPLPNYLSLPIQSGTNNDICDWNFSPTTPTTDFGSCSTCHNCCPDGLSAKIEIPYHDNGHAEMGGAMFEFTSPLVLAFWLWHAHLDDLWKSWEQNCPQSTTLPVDLYMKDNHKVMENWRDRGEEPSFDPNNLIYLSQDIWLRKTNDGFTNHESETPEWVSGQPFYVYVRVRNRGYQTSLGTEQVHLYWAKANTGLNWPSAWNGTTFVSGVLMGDEIGQQTLTNVIDAGDQQILEFLWNNPPDPLDYEDINEDPFHFCLLARVVASNDPMTFAETNDLAANVRNNNNIAWKNTRILNYTPGIVQGGGDCHEDIMQGMGTAVAVTNPHDYVETFDVVFQTIHEVGHCDHEGCTHEDCTIEVMVHDFSGETHEHRMVTVKDEGLPITEEGTVMIALSDGLYEKWVRGGKKGSGFKEVLSPPMSTQGTNNNQINANSPLILSDRKLFEITADPATFENITLQGGELHTTTMVVLYPSDPISNKQEFNYDIIQRESATGKFIGAVRYEIDKPDCSDKKAYAGSDKAIDIGCSTTLNADPELTCANYYWLDQNGDLISRNSNITVSPSKTTTYTLKVVSEEGCLTEDKVTVNVSNQFCLKEREIVKITPNPAKDRVVVEYKVPNTNTAQLRLVKMDNSFERTHSLDLSTNQTTIDISQFPMGAYIVTLVVDGVNEDSKNLMILK
ncbi:MAG: tyrosinase family protein [Bacteroidia bacterium]